VVLGAGGQTSRSVWLLLLLELLLLIIVDRE